MDHSPCSTIILIFYTREIHQPNRLATPKFMDDQCGIRDEAPLYTILYRETVRAAKTADQAINRINKLCRISGQRVFESNPHPRGGEHAVTTEARPLRAKLQRMPELIGGFLAAGGTSPVRRVQKPAGKAR
jgi:hypothetical protein